MNHTSRQWSLMWWAIWWPKIYHKDRMIWNSKMRTFLNRQMVLQDSLDLWLNRGSKEEWANTRKIAKTLHRLINQSNLRTPRNLRWNRYLGVVLEIVATQPLVDWNLWSNLKIIYILPGTISILQFQIRPNLKRYSPIMRDKICCKVTI